jgi:selenocysteine lyase/cysteine desulfurase
MTTRRDFLATGAVSVLGARSASALDERSKPSAEFMMSPGLVYLNTGSTGPTPRAVLERTLQAWTELETNPVAQAYGQDGVLAWTDGVRERVAAFLGCTVDEVLIARSTSEGMNTVAQSMRLNAGDRVLTTDQEHEGGSACWEYLAERRGVVVDTVAIPLDEYDPSAIVRRIADAVKPQTKVISVSHIFWTNGLRMPIPEISALARQHGILSVVDGAQAAGAMPVDVKALGCHAYATTGHKWVLGPKGTGMLYVSADAGDAIKPIQWMAGKRVTSGATGIGPLPLVVGLGAAVDAAVARGPASIEAHNLALRERALRGLRAMPKLRIVSPASGPQATAFVSFVLPDAVDNRELQVLLRTKYNVVTKVIERKRFNGLRISPHVFNTEADVDALLAALRHEVR